MANYYQDRIAEITGAKSEELVIVENILRDDVFHSTLDWQTAKEFKCGARKAYRIYLDDKAFFDGHHAQMIASFSR